MDQQVTMIQIQITVTVSFLVEKMGLLTALATSFVAAFVTALSRSFVTTLIRSLVAAFVATLVVTLVVTLVASLLATVDWFTFVSHQFHHAGFLAEGGVGAVVALHGFFAPERHFDCTFIHARVWPR